MIYVASSWRNTHQPSVVLELELQGYRVYDFKHPAPDEYGFKWEEIDGEWKSWSLNDYKRGLDHSLAWIGYGRDLHALTHSDACVLVLPCGASAHMEFSYMLGQHKPGFIYKPDGEGFRIELMYKMASGIVGSLTALGVALRDHNIYPSGT